MVYNEPAPGQASEPGVVAEANNSIVIGKEVVLVNVITGTVFVPFVAVNPLIPAGGFGMVQVISAFAVGDVIVTPLVKPCEQMV